MSTPSPPEPDWPTDLGCYAVERPVTAHAALGRGPAGRPVWLHRSDCPGAADDPCGAEREHAALSANPSGAVPEALDLVRQSGVCWSVTEVVDGVSLAAALAAGREVESDRVAAHLLAALRRAHAAGWVHGDVKPSNVMLRPDGTVVLVDWELATRVGRAVPPGSLGYAPPHAWGAGHVAETRNDVYALAVLLREVETGERLFSGDRESVLAAQRKHSLAPSGPASGLVDRVCVAADAGSGSEAIELDWRGAVLDVRRRQVVRLAARAAASSLVADLRRGAAAVATTVAFRDQARELVRAVADRWRVTTRENAVALDAVSPVLMESDDGPGAGLEAELRRQRDGARSLGRRLRALPPGVVFVEAAAAAGDLALGVQELERELEAADETAWRVMRIAAGERESVSRGALRGAVRDALQVLLATAHVSAALCEAIVRVRPVDLGPALEAVMRVARDGGLTGDSGQVEFAVGAGGSQRDWIDRLDRSLSALRVAEPPATPGPREGAAEGDILADAERRLLRGDVVGAHRLMIRATTNLMAQAGSVPPHAAVRLADLWLEYGQLEAARQVLTWSADIDDFAVLRRQGRVAVTLGDADGLTGVLSALCERGEHAGNPELLRFEAARSLLLGDLDASVKAAKLGVRRARESGDSLRLVDLLTLRSEIAAKRGRRWSARRLLRHARSIADDLGATRLALRIDANLLVSSSSGEGGSAAAAAWRDLAERSRRWGLHAAACRHAVRAATLFLQADDLDAAEEMLEAVQASRLDGARLNPVWGQMAVYLRQQVAARRDEPLAPVPEPTAGGRLPWWRWLATELMTASMTPCPELAAVALPRRARVECVRVARLVVRWVARGGDASARLARVLAAGSGAFGSQSPAVGGLARLVARGAADPWPLVGLLAVLRDRLDEDESARELALAFHAAAFVWGGVVDTTAATWLRTHAPEIDAGRPYGILTWEWRLAMLRADAALGSEPDVDARLERVLDALEEWSEGLAADERRQLLAIVPFDVIAETAGFAGPEGLSIPQGGESLVAFRAHLRREAVRFRGSRGRAAGLERVLQSALRLRSGCSVDEVLQETVSGVLAVCRAERSVVVYEAGGGDRRAKLATLERLQDVGPSDAEVSESAVEHARREGRACIFDDACGSAEFGDSPSVRLYRPRSLMIAPLQAHGVTLGYLYVENRSLPKSFSRSDLQLLEGFASQAALALDNARLVEELRGSLEEIKRVRTEAVRAESLRVLGQMAGEVAHDFNNLLAVILGETQLLLQDRPDAGIERSLEVIERAAMDGAAAIRRIQSSTRARPREEFTVVDLAELVRDVLDFTRVRWSSGGDPGRAVRTRCRSARDVHVSGLAPELREVFTNLVLNAVDAMPDGGDLVVSVRPDGDEAEVEVRDTGTGIPAEIVERVFDPFFSTKGESGNGLGLAIAKEIVERHGGRIEVASSPGRGSRIRVRLPRVARPGGDGAEPPPAARDRADPAMTARGSVLVVDDEEGVLRVLAAMLRSEGYDVTAAASGDEALRRLEAGETFDVLLTDLYMPGTSGVDVIEATRRTAGARRVVVMSGYGDVVGDGRIARRSVDGVLAKPFTLSDVREAVGRPE